MVADEVKEEPTEETTGSAPAPVPAPEAEAEAETDKKSDKGKDRAGKGKKKGEGRKGKAKDEVKAGDDKKMSRKEESEWLSGTLKKMEKKTKVDLIVEVDGEMAGHGGVEKAGLGATRYVALLGIGLGRKYRDMGIGTELIKTLCDVAKDVLKARVVQIPFYENNKIARRAYEKGGFREAGRIPKGCYYYGKFYDEVIMVKEL